MDKSGVGIQILHKKLLHTFYETHLLSPKTLNFNVFFTKKKIVILNNIRFYNGFYLNYVIDEGTRTDLRNQILKFNFCM